MSVSAPAGAPTPGAPAPGAPAPAAQGWMARAVSDRQVAAGCLLSACYAGAIALFSGNPVHRTWGTCAAAGYAAAALALLSAALPGRSRERRSRERGRGAALVLSLAGALAAPLAWLAAAGRAQPEAGVVARSAVLLLRHGTPYLSAARPGQAANPYAYDPYLPLMSLFGLPRAAGLDGVAGDPRLWLAIGSLVLAGAAFRVAGQRRWLRCTAMAAASPLLAFPLAVGGTDVPVLALLCLGLACTIGPPRHGGPAGPGGIRPSAAAAGAVIGVACAMKYTAWPAVPVAAAMLAARDGARQAARFAAATVIVAGAAVFAAAPAVAGNTAALAALARNTLLYPLGLTPARSPAASPLPGHLLAGTGTAGHLAALGLLAAAGLAVTASLFIRPPAGVPAAAGRLALGLALMFALAPATRWGYFLYPLGLAGWAVLAGAGARRGAEPG